jgi:hypothetical protein
MSNYFDEWSSAVKRTKDFGLAVPDHEIVVDKIWLDAKAYAEFPYAVLDVIGELSLEEISLQCISIHYRLMPVIQRWLGCQVTYTVGWVDDETPKGIYHFDEKFIKDTLENGHPTNQVRLHTWLTLPSLEVIDVSLPTSMGVVQKKTELLGGVIAQKADALIGMKYKPMLVGDDYIFKTKLLMRT